MPKKQLPVVNVYEKLLYVDTCRYDLHISEELRQHYILTSEKSVPAIVNTTDRQPKDYKSQGQFDHKVYLLKFIIICIRINFINLYLEVNRNKYYITNFSIVFIQPQ